MDAKKPYLSKTILINALMGLIAVASMFVPSAAGLGDLIKAHLPEIAAGWSVVGILLRLVTKDKISLAD